MRILYTGGGTGGHIYPILAVNEKVGEIGLRNRIKIETFYLGAPGMFTPILESAGIKTQKIIASKLRRYFDPMNFVDAPKFAFSFFQALWKIFWIMPDVLFSKGGPGALAVVLAANFFRIPIIIHESDTVPGLTNQFSSKYAKRIGISFASAAEYFSNKNNIALIGNPVRNDLLKDVLDPNSAKKVFGFEENKPLILVIGGSQGSERINDAVIDLLPELIKEYGIIHVAGIANLDKAKKEAEFILKESGATENDKSKYKVLPYLEKNYKDAMSAADLIISRAGSGSIFEIAAFGKPSILIPLPESAGDHQTRNAYDYGKTGAASVIEEANVTPNIFLTQIKKILSDENVKQSMSSAAKSFAKPQAAETIAEKIIELGK